MVGSYCFESDCTTVWAKIPGEEGQEEITAERISAGNVVLETNFDRVHTVYENGVKVTSAIVSRLNNVVKYETEHIGNYCLVQDDWRYTALLIDVDFEFMGRDVNTPGKPLLHVPRMQAKRLAFGRRKQGDFSYINRIRYSNSTNPDDPCSWIDVKPSDYGGTDDYWTGYLFTWHAEQKEEEQNITFYLGENSQAWINEQYTHVVKYSIPSLRDIVFSSGVERIFDGREPFLLDWTRVDRIDTTVIQAGIPDQDDTWQAFKVEKQPYLEKVEVVDFAYNFGFGAPGTAGDPTIEIPRNCLNIYKTVTNPQSNDVVFPNLASNAEFIAQFCTDDPAGTEPPEYYVVCGCDKCPPGTCEIDCGDHICCYNSQGIAELVINK